MSALIQIADLLPAPVPPGAIRTYHAMVKPVGAICNLDCSYCYYLHKEQLLGSPSKFRIADDILEAHIRQYIEGQDHDEAVFSWQGAARFIGVTAWVYVSAIALYGALSRTLVFRPFTTFVVM